MHITMYITVYIKHTWNTSTSPVASLAPIILPQTPVHLPKPGPHHLTWNTSTSPIASLAPIILPGTPVHLP